MQPQTVAALLTLNRQFYTRFAGEFSRTRRSWPPGYSRILPYLETGFNVLDLGCGNGRFLVFLGESGWEGRYVGLDSSRALLADASQTAANYSRIASSFVFTDLLAADWAEGVRRMVPFDALVSLAVLHHIPGRENRIDFLARCAQLLPPSARLIVSTWQFMTSERLRKRLVPWERAGIDPAHLDPADRDQEDYLIAWGEGSPGVRYCAYIDEPALELMAAEAGLTTVETFTSDGHEGNLNLYAVFAAGNPIAK